MVLGITGVKESRGRKGRLFEGIIVIWKVFSSVDLSWKYVVEYVAAIRMTFGKATEVLSTTTLWDRGRNISSLLSSRDREESPSQYPVKLKRVSGIMILSWGTSNRTCRHSSRPDINNKHRLDIMAVPFHTSSR